MRFNRTNFILRQVDFNEIRCRGQIIISFSVSTFFQSAACRTINCYDWNCTLNIEFCFQQQINEEDHVTNQKEYEWFDYNLKWSFWVTSELLVNHLIQFDKILRIIPSRPSSESVDGWQPSSFRLKCELYLKTGIGELVIV